MNKWDDAYDEKMDSQIRIIKEYDLFELSLVDTPANQFANILSVEKVDGVDTVKGVDTQIENVFWDSESGIVLISENEVEQSPASGAPMQNIGFVEKSDNEKTEMIKFLVDSAKGIKTTEINKEVSPMTDTTNEVVEAVADEAVVEETTVEESQVAPEAEAGEEVAADAGLEKGEVTTSAVTSEEAAEPATDDAPAEPADEATESVAKSDNLFDAAIADVKEVVTKAFSDLTAVVQAQAEQIAELSKSIGAVKNEVTATTNVFNEFGKRVDAVEADTAFRKSGDLGEIVQEQPEQVVEKSLWGGRFLKATDLFK
jgi:flagellin-like hook-associated protein FlgL